MNIDFWVAIPVVALLIPITALIVDGLKNIKEKEFRHHERLKAIESGDQTAIQLLSAPVEVAKEATVKVKSRSPAFHGAIWTGLGGGLLASSVFIMDRGTSDDMQGFANFLMLWAVPALGVGIALVIYGIFSRNGNGTQNGG